MEDELSIIWLIMWLTIWLIRILQGFYGPGYDILFVAVYLLYKIHLFVWVPWWLRRRYKKYQNMKMANSIWGDLKGI